MEWDASVIGICRSPEWGGMGCGSYEILKSNGIQQMVPSCTCSILQPIGFKDALGIHDYACRPSAKPSGASRHRCQCPEPASQLPGKCCSTAHAAYSIVHGLEIAGLKYHCTLSGNIEWCLFILSICSELGCPQGGISQRHPRIKEMQLPFQGVGEKFHTVCFFQCAAHAAIKAPSLQIQPC